MMFKKECQCEPDNGHDMPYTLPPFYRKAMLQSRRFLGIIMVILLWYLASWWVDYQLGVEFPTPVITVIRLLDLLAGEQIYSHSIYTHVTASLIRWGAGYLLAVIFGIGLGSFLGFSRTAHEIFMPAMYIFQLIPGLAWIPIALLLFGIGNTATIFMIFMTSLVPIVINTSGGIRDVPPIYVHTARNMGASLTEIFFRVMFPASVLSMINGLRIGLAGGWRVLIAAEMIVGVGTGIGYSIEMSRWTLDFRAAFAFIMVILAIGLLIERILFEAIERKIIYNIGVSNNERKIPGM